jgi:alginate O-acetyltransferase complex protein AlgJ
MGYRAVAAFFLALLFLPVIQGIYPLVPLAPLDEKRAPSPFPRIGELYDRTSDALAAGINAWFDDRIGFRDLFIRLKNQIDYSVFRSSTKVVIGRDGWLYNRINLDNRIGVERASADKVNQMEGVFDWLQAYAAARCMMLVVVSYPDKITIYPEQMAASFLSMPKRPVHVRIREYLRAKPGIIYIDGEPILREESRRYRVFYKTDAHTNFHGSVAMVRAIVSRIADALGRSEVRWNEQFQMGVYPWTQGFEARSIPLLKPLGEEIDWATDFYEVYKNTTDTTWSAAAPMALIPGLGERPVFDWLARAADGGGDRLPPAALFGNSFSDFWFSLGIQRYFSEIRRSRTSAERLFPYLETLPPHVKILIYQYNEPNLIVDMPDYRAHMDLIAPAANTPKCR